MDMYYQRVSEGPRREFFWYVENGLPQEWNKFTSAESYKFLWNELSDSLEKDYHKNKVDWSSEKYENWQQQEFLQKVMQISAQNCDKSEEVFFEFVDQL